MGAETTRTIHNLFPTVVMQYDLSNHSEVNGVREVIDQMRTSKHILIGDGRSSYGVDQPVLNNLPNLHDLFQRCVNDYSNHYGLDQLSIGYNWYNVIGDSGTVERHRHAASVISGAFYPHVEDGAGDIRFHSPLTPLMMNMVVSDRDKFFDTNYASFPCMPNTLYLFPSWLEHDVPINRSDNRYVISFNTLQTNGVGVPQSSL